MPPNKDNRHQWHNRIIKESVTFDSTKGYPGEGPTHMEDIWIPHAARKKKEKKTNISSTNKGDKRWESALDRSGTLDRNPVSTLAKNLTVGDDLFYKPREPLTWDQLTGTVAELNMNG